MQKLQIIKRASYLLQVFGANMRIYFGGAATAMS